MTDKKVEVCLTSTSRLRLAVRSLDVVRGLEKHLSQWCARLREEILTPLTRDADCTCRVVQPAGINGELRVTLTRSVTSGFAMSSTVGDGNVPIISNSML